MLSFFVLLPYLLSFSVSCIMGYYAWRRRTMLGAMPFAFFSFVEAIGTFFFILELLSTQVADKLFWDQVQWGISLLLPVFWWEFTRHHLSQERKRTAMDLSLFVPSLLLFMLIVTDFLHGLAYTNVHMKPHEPFDELYYDFAPLLSIATIYLYGFFAVSIYLLWRARKKRVGIYRRQFSIFILAALLPLIGSAGTFVLGIKILGQRDVSPFVFLLGNLIAAWGMFRRQIFDLAPIARSMVIDSLKDAVVVLDAENRVVDLNRIARSAANPALTDVIGLTIEQVFPDWIEEIRQVNADTSELHFEIHVQKPTSPYPYYIEVDVSPIHDAHGREVGRVLVTHDITHLRLAEIALRESEERYRLLAENTTDFVSLHNPDGGFIYASPSFLKESGYPLDELQQMGVEALIHPHDLPRVREEIEQGIRTGHVITEYRRRKKSGEYTWAESVLQVVYDSQGNVSHLLNSSRDISRRKEAELARQIAEFRAQRYLNTAAVMMMVLNDRGEITFINNKGCELLGYSRKELLGKSWMEFLVSEKSRDTALTTFRRLTTGEEDSQGYIYFENWLRLQSGEERLFALHNSLVLVGTSVEILISGEDITERRQAEEALRESQRFIEQVNLAIPDLVYIFDLNQQRRIYSNRNIGAELGYSSEEIPLDPVQLTELIMLPSDYQQMLQGTMRLFSAQDSEVLEFESRFLHKDGKFRWRSDRDVIYTRNPDGTPAQFLGISRDITEQKLAQQRQAQLMLELENANRDLKDFAYIVSHDLKAPLRGINTVANWLLHDYADRLDNEGHNLLELLMGRVRRLEKLIDGVLAYSRVGRTQETTANIDLNTLLPEVIDSIIPKEACEVTVEFPLPIVRGEKTRLMQVFQNLLSNAVKFMDKPQGKIQIGYEAQENFWKFWVADNGPGIDQRHFTRIFQIFQTLNARDDHESTGVGLTIVKRIVELYGGQIWVDSTVGIGSTFYFTLPRERSNGEPQPGRSAGRR